MRPPKRQKKNVETVCLTSGVRMWTLEDLKALLKALKSCHRDDIGAIQKKFLPERTQNEINGIVARLRVTNPARLDGTDSSAPIEMWLQKSEQLQRYDLDHSRVLAQIVSVISTLEPRAAVKQSTDPDYNAIYRYLATLLNRETPPTLTPIEAAILLDILDGLADHLKSLDTSDQQALMRQKFKLLTDSVNVYSPRDVLAVVKKHLKEDTLETSGQTAAGNDLQHGPAQGMNGRTSVGSNDSRVTETTASSGGPCGSNLKGETEHDGDRTQHDDSVEGGDDGRCTEGERPLAEDRPVQENNSAVCSLMPPWYSLNPFCIDRKYLNPETNSS